MRPGRTRLPVTGRFGEYLEKQIADGERMPPPILGFGQRDRAVVFVDVLEAERADCLSKRVRSRGDLCAAMSSLELRD